MKQTVVTRATLGRLPLYLQYLKSPMCKGNHISATIIAKALGLGEVQVRKDLNFVSGMGKPKIGYQKKELIDDIEAFLGLRKRSSAVIIGVGKLGTALFGFDGFSDYGLEITAAFDCDEKKIGKTIAGKTVYSLEQLKFYCRMYDIRIGVITVPESYAQDVCNKLVDAGITAIWNFAPVALTVPEPVLVQQENLALSLAHLNTLINHRMIQEVD